MKIPPLMAFLVFSSQISFAQTWQDTLSLVDKSFSQYQATNPGCQLSVSRNGQIILSRAWGMANLEQNSPLSATSVLEPGSISKQFTAAAILLLEQQGKLSLDDDVRKYIPELPDYGHVIRLRHMLHHTSGLRAWERIASLTGWPRGRKFYTNEDVLDIIVHQKHLNNTPGNEFLYSNSNYNLFTIIVRRVSGLTLAEFTRQYIFVPAGMTHTQWRDDPNKIVLNRATAYTRSGSSYTTDMPNEYVYGQGGLLTTTEDLLKWCEFYQRNKLGSPSLLSRQIQTEPLTNGEMNIYAAGLFVRKNRGWNSISHDGATASYRGWLETFPDLGLSFAVLSNTSEFNIRKVAGKVSQIFVPDKTEKDPEPETSIDLPESDLEAFTGMYRNERDGSTFQLSAKDKKLMLDNNLPLTAVSGNTFKAGNFLLKIMGGKGLYISGPPRDSIPFTKVRPADISREDIKDYEGRYSSEETNSSLVTRVDSGRLIMHLKPGVDYLLTPTYKDGFNLGVLGCDLHYIRNSSNHVVAMKISFGDARNIEFKK